MEEKPLGESIYDRPPRRSTQDPTPPQAQAEPAPPEDPQGPEPEPQAPPEDEPLPEFDQRHRESLTGLMFLGRLEDEFEWLGHKFVVRTLTTDEHLQAGLIMKPYLGTRAEWRAWQAVQVAAGCVSVDAQPIYVPVTTTQSRGEELRERFNFVIKNWYAPVIDAVYRRIAGLEITSRAVVEQMGKVGG